MTRYLFGFICVLTLGVMGCSETAGTGGSGGVGGVGGVGGTGGMALACLPVEDILCANTDIDPIEPCCALLAPPDQENACTGNESLVNPTSCTATGTTVMYQLVLLKIAGDCNVGYDLDTCNGYSCERGLIAPGEGIDGVDNALAGLASVQVFVG